MENANMAVVLPLALGIMLIALLTLVFLGQNLSKQKKRAQHRLRRLQGRFGSNTMITAERSIRLNTQEEGFLATLSGLLPQRDVLVNRLEQAGMKITLSQYAGLSAILALVMLAIMLLLNSAAVLSLLVSILTGAGVPHVLVGSRIKSRIAAFNKQFPEAIDLMVRGLKSGLPVNETIANVSVEVGDPIGGEFGRIVDEMRLGKTLEQSLWSASKRLDSPDFKFFITSLNVQRETGGNLGETLSNLSNILRSRQAMKLKINALSSEAKASAVIVGVLPFIMLGLIMMLNYDYGIILFTHPTAIIACISALVWMFIGIVVMVKMINFEA